MQFVPVPSTPDYLKAYAPHWLPFLPKISRRSKEAVADLFDQVMGGQVQVALVFDEANVAQALVGMRYTKRGDDRIGEVCWLTGSGARHWLDLLPEMERYLKEHMRCAVIRPVCRPGWARLIRGKGYRVTHYLMEKTL